MPFSVLTTLGDDLFVVRGRQAVLALAPMLQELTRRTGQLGAMHWLDYFLNTPSLIGKPPYLVLQMRRISSCGRLTPDLIRAAALFFEYRVCGLRTRVFCTDDAVGFRTVIAEREERAHFAERAAFALLQSGAHMVLATYETPEESGALPQPVPDAFLGYRQRIVGRMLTLAPTYDEMLAQLGRLTRRNLRYYRRHLASRMPLDFVADARTLLTFPEFKGLNDSSLNPVRSDKELWLRWHNSCEIDGGFVVGLRTAGGKWLSLIGGWRHDTSTVVHWQLNSGGYERDSIGVVIRSFFLEHEIANGARRLLMFGGTPHSIHSAFEEDSIADLVLCRPTLRASVLRVLAHQLVQHSARARTNHLLQTLAEISLTPQAVLSPRSDTTIKQPATQTSQAG